MSSSAQSARPMKPLHLPWIGVAALVVGAVVATLIPQAQGGNLADGLKWTLFMLASASVSSIFGLIFGVPRVRSDFVPTASERYVSNSNLEQISDWLTKVLVGATLVELKNLPGYLRRAAEYFGAEIGVPNGAAFAATALIYGAGVGFATTYLWIRLHLRKRLEGSDREAADESKSDTIVEQLRSAKGSAQPNEPEPLLRKAADKAVAEVQSSDPRHRGAVLWVDDQPGNNTSVVATLASLGIRVDLALTTEDGLERLKRTNDYRFVISDLSRWENGQVNHTAGQDFLESMRDYGFDTPFCIYTSNRGLGRRKQLMDSGADLVTSSPTEVFSAAVSATL